MLQLDESEMGDSQKHNQMKETVRIQTDGNDWKWSEQ